jgi:hypothetical protein
MPPYYSGVPEAVGRLQRAASERPRVRR